MNTSQGFNGSGVRPIIGSSFGPSSGASSPTSTLSGSTRGFSFDDRNNRPQSPTAMTANAKRNKYLKRLFKFRQMDFEYALWQMLYLFVAPQKVYRNFGYRKQNKGQWARDDPAFLVLLTFWLCASSVGFAFVLSLSVVSFIKFLLWVVFVDCIGVGILLATALWLLFNRYLLVQPPRGQDVEWGYCFDIHLNAFFPLLMILHFFQLPFLNLFIYNESSYLACLFGNTIWLVAIGYYIYITFLGYSNLPFLKQTKLLLYPMTGLALFYLLSVLLGWNFSIILKYFYKYRVV